MNPDKYIRKAFADLLTQQGLLVFDKQVPKSKGQPREYVLIQSQTKLWKNLGRACRIWDCTINLDLYIIQDLSYVSTAELDDYEEIVLDNVKLQALNIQNYRISDLMLDGSPRDLSFNAITQSIQRKLMTYRLIIDEDSSEVVTPTIEDGFTYVLPFAL